MTSIDALARAIKEFDGGVVIVSHDFREHLFGNLGLIFSNSMLRILGLISQVAEELWEVKNKTIRNLTREDISIVDYKKLLMKDSKFKLSFISTII